MLSKLLLVILLVLPASARLVSVSLIENTPQAVISSDADYSLIQDGRVIYKFDADSKTIVKPGTLINKSKNYFISGEFSFESKKLLEVEGHKFRGVIVIASPRSVRGDPRTVQVINRLELEDYLKSVVSSEMPSRWPLEALKAQAVCARTYTLNTLQHKDVLQSGVADQMYLGYDREDDRGRKAVEETNGQVMVDNLGNYVDAYYSSSGGNYTSSVSDVWGLSARPYLLPVNDYAQGSSYQSWTRDFTTKELESMLADLRLPEIQSITVFQRSIEGRATRIQITGKQNYDSSSVSKFKTDSNGDIFEAISPQAKSQRKPLLATRYLSGEELRHKLGLPSTNFQLIQQADKYSFRGTGFGHGIGMTQYGAKNMAESGAGYREILNHYYQSRTTE